MPISSQEVPLILTIGVGAFGAAFIIFYRNCLGRKNDQPSAMQTAYAWFALSASFATIAKYICPHPILKWLDWGLSGSVILYILASLFFTDVQTAMILAWSDVFLVGLNFLFLALKYYAISLLTYQRARTPSLNHAFILPNPSIPKDEELYPYDDSAL